MSIFERSPKFFKQIVASAAVLATVVGCSSDSDFPTPSQSITEIVVETERFSILEAAVVAADLAGVLSEGEYTVFAPNDDAFVAALDDLGLTAEELLADTETLTSILLYHVVPGTVDANAAISVASSDTNLVPTAGGDEVALSVSTENDVNVLYVNTSPVIATNIRATNGIIHEVDSVIVPAFITADDSNDDQTIAGIVSADADFSILLAAVSALNLVDALNGAGPLTVFAPTDAAFEAAGITAATLPANDVLGPIVTQHVLGFEAQSVTAYAANGSDLATLNTDALLPIRIEGGVLKAGNANVTKADIIASNGVIHVVDAVITEVVEAP